MMIIEFWIWFHSDERKKPAVQSFDDNQNLRQIKNDEILASWRTAEAFGIAALKSAIILNGASAAGTLAFIASTNKSSTDLSSTMQSFALGTFAAVIATGTAYLTAYAENRAIWAWVNRKNTFQYFLYSVNRWLHIFTLATLVYSYWSFLAGLHSGLKALGGTGILISG